MPTLPPCVITLPAPHYCPPGQHWNGVECVDDGTGPTPPDTNTPGLVYFACYQGVAVCINPMTSDRKWIAINTGFTDADSRHVNAFNLDPYSYDADKECYQRAWTISNDGVWRGDGLPDPTWTLKLSLSDLTTLLGAGTWHLTSALALDVLNKDHVYLLVGIPGGVGYNIYIVWTEDAGETWQGGFTNLSSNSLLLSLTPSQHISGTFYITGHIGDYSYLGTWKSESLPGFTRYFWTVDNIPTNVTQDQELYIPYSDEMGNLNAHDNLAYYYAGYADAGNLVKVTNLNSQPIPTGTVVLAGYSTWRNTPFVWTQNGNYLYVARHNATNNTLKLSQDGGASFADSVIDDMATSFITNLFILAADYRIAFVCGEADTNDVRVVYTTDFGDSYTRIDNPSGAELKDVLGISTDDCENAFILADNKFAGGVVPSTDATLLDVSHYQGAMDWATAASAGITGAFIKASQGASYTDPQFATNWSNASSAGVNRGSYHYFENATDPTSQANHYVAVASEAGELGYAVDCEDESTSLDPTDLKTFLDRVETLTGAKPTIYTRASWWNKYVGYQPWASAYPLWVAHWNVAVPTLPTGWSNYQYWQFSDQGAGSVYGAQSNFVDLNKAAG